MCTSSSCQVDFSSWNKKVQCGAIQAAAPTIKRPKITSAFELVKVPTLLLNVQTSRPLEALELLRRNLPRDEAGLKEWRHMARVAAVMGSCPRSLQSFTSGLV
jgi:hypothetical protein